MVKRIGFLTDPCESCGRVPTAAFRFRSNSGFMFRRWVQTYQGRLCRICARGVFRDMQARNATLGWWGFASFVGTIVYLIDNRWALRRGINSLRPPFPANPLEDRKLLGRMVFARPSVLLVIVIFLGGAVGVVTRGFGIHGDQWEVGACVNYSGTSVIVVPCDDPTWDDRVLAIIDNVFACPAEADYFVDLDSAGVACLG